MKFDIAQQDGVIQVQVQGDLSRTGCAEGLIEVRKTFSEKPRDVVLDFSKVEHVSSFALASVLRLKDFVRSQERDFRLVNPSAPVRLILEKTGLQRHFEAAAASPAAGVEAPSLSQPVKPEAEDAHEFLQKEDSKSQEALQALETGMQSMREDRERLTSKIMSLEGRLTELQAVSQERDELVREIEGLRLRDTAYAAKMAEASLRIEALERTRAEAVAQGAALAGKVEEMMQTAAQQAAQLDRKAAELAEACKKLEALEAAEESLAQARRREEALGKQLDAVTRCLADVQTRIAKTLGSASGTAGSDAPENGRLRMPTFARDPLREEEAVLLPPRGPLVTPP